MVQAGEQTEAAETDQVVEVDDVRPELVQARKQAMDVVGVDVVRLHLGQRSRDPGGLGGPEGIINVVELQAPVDVRRYRDRVARAGCQHVHFVAPVAQPIDDLSADEFIAADNVGRIEVAEDEDLHAAASVPGRAGRLPQAPGARRMIAADAEDDKVTR